MKIALEPYVRACIEADLGRNLAEGVGMAVRHYADRLRSPERPVVVPPFRRGLGAETVADVRVDLSIEADVEAALMSEAQRQGVSVDRIVGHAVFVYLSDRDRAEGNRRAPLGEEEAALALSPI